jgi:hypothetical protein
MDRRHSDSPSRIQAIERRIEELEREQVEVADELRELRETLQALAQPATHGLGAFKGPAPRDKSDGRRFSC